MKVSFQGTLAKVQSVVSVYFGINQKFIPWHFNLSSECSKQNIKKNAFIL